MNEQYSFDVKVGLNPGERTMWDMRHLVGYLYRNQFEIEGGKVSSKTGQFKFYLRGVLNLPQKISDTIKNSGLVRSVEITSVD